MKKTIKLLLACGLLFAGNMVSNSAYAQVPQKFNYQGIARDTKGNPMANQQLALKLSVLPTADATEPEYVETQLITTNEFGLYTLQIGGGTVVVGDMKTVKWETGNKYIRVAIDPQGGTNYVDAGTTQLLSVPYAIYADKAGVARESVNAGGTTRATNNFVEKTSSTGVVNSTSQIYDNGSGVAIGGFTNPIYTLESRKNANTDWCIRTTNAAGTSRAAFRIQNEDSTLGQIDFTKFGKSYGGTFMGISRNNMAGINSLTGPFVLNCGGDMIFGNSLTVSPFTQTPRMTINGTTGNVGFGLPLGGAATARVEVNGQIKITGGAPGAGKVLTSNAVGLATWQTPAATGVTGSGTTNYIPKFTPSGTALGNSTLYDDGAGQVGFGTTTPTARISVFTSADSAIVSNANISKDSASGNVFLSNSNAVGNMTFGAIGQVTGSDFGAGLFGRGFGATYAPFTTRDIGVYGSANFGNTAIGVLGSSDNGSALMGVSKTGSAAYLKSPNGTALLADSGNAIVNTGNLGVGVLAPSYKFHSVIPNGYSGFFQSTGTDNWVGFQNSNGYNAYLGSYLNPSSAFDVMTPYSTMDLNLGTNYATRIKVKGDGNVGIGTETPSSILNISKPNEPILTITESTPTSGDTMSIDFIKPGSGWTDWRVGTILLGGNFVIQTGSNDFASTPSTPFQISPSGITTVSDLQITNGTQGDGKILQSDVNGNAQWVNSSTGATNSGSGFAPSLTTAMLTPSNSFTITSTTQKVFWTATKAMGSVAAGGATSLQIAPAYYNTATPATIQTIGSFILGLRCAANTRQTYTISGFTTGLTPGTYSFGMAGSSTDAASWNSNEYGYVTVMVME